MKAAIFALAACAALCACAPSDQAPVKLAVAVPLTGDLAADGKGIERAVRLAVDDQTAKGGLPAPVQVEAFDDGGDRERAAAVAREVAADTSVFAVVGHLTSGCSLEASRVYAASGLAMITPSATAPQLTLQQTKPEWTGPRVVFRLPPSDAIQGSYAAEFARQLGLERVYVVEDGTAYGESLAAEFERAFQSRGGGIVGQDAVARGAKDFSTALSRAAAQRPDGLFYGGVYSEAGLLLRQARERGLRAAFLSGDGSKTDDIFRIAGPAADGAYFTVSGVPVESLPSASDFVERYKARYGGQAPRTYDAYGYEAAEAALQALRKRGRRREKIVDALRALSFESMLGLIAFDGKGDSLKSTITMTRANFKEKRFEPVY
jgi:branched-chain amino acid transport system substrate-binding protein